ncbi:hypothetical protein EVAR_69284_1 [Eumeta japonica]|uniref:Uncharacterized protein n=1 Tax=Eumeta variegata TaxID=151549 RepID=A0A4C1SIR5_EUMVA|nr:hypothetical protein EVAR_69284_1 [Eumeta japonica]
MSKGFSPSWCLLLIGCIQFKVACADYIEEGNSLNITTGECSLTEPIYGHKFDFSALRSDFAHLTRSHWGDTFEFNICGNITRKCNGRSDVAACLKKSNNKEYVLERGSPQKGGCPPPERSSSFSLARRKYCCHGLVEDPMSYLRPSCMTDIALRSSSGRFPFRFIILPKKRGLSYDDIVVFAVKLLAKTSVSQSFYIADLDSFPSMVL